MGVTIIITIIITVALIILVLLSDGRSLVNAVVAQLRFKTDNDDIIMSLTNSFAATAGTNIRNAAFRIVHPDLLYISQKFVSNKIMSTV